MKTKLIQTENRKNFKEFKLCNEENEYIVSFDVEIEKETALISYDTKEEFRHQGFASLGLNLLKEILFDDNILFLELIDLSGDYSRKVAENAGFFSPSNSLNHYIALNPRAEEIVNNRIHDLDPNLAQFKKGKKQLEKINYNRHKEDIAREKMHNKLEQLMKQNELIEPGDYKKSIEAEISHLQKILMTSQKEEKKTL